MPRQVVCFAVIGCCRVICVEDAARRLEMAAWQLAWDRYALAAAVVGQLTFTQAMQHKSVVMEAWRVV